MSAPFTHLHLHSHYSLLTSTVRIPELIQKTKSLGQDSIALTDSGNLFGAVEFVKEAKKGGIRPILGSQLLCLPSHFSKSLNTDPALQRFKPQFHFAGVLTENLEGYQSLCRLMSRAYARSFTESQQAKNTKTPFLEPWGGVPEFDSPEFQKGLFYLVGGMRSEPSYLILQGREDLAHDWFKEKKARLGERLWIELSVHGFPKEEEINSSLEKIGKSLGIPRVGTVAVHYLKTSDAQAQEVLQCIEYNRNLDLNRAASLVPSGYDLKTSEEMRDLLSRFDGAYEGAIELGSRCNAKLVRDSENGKTVYHLPEFRPKGVERGQKFSAEDYFRKKAQDGLKEIFARPTFKGDQKIYEARLNDEIQMILKTGFAGYFLIVSDFINWAKDQSIPVGPGRGSGAGSLVAYALRITGVDPIPLDLLFERFINPERVSLPDFDIDFCQERRGEVIEYVKSKYGLDRVSQIITFGKLQTKAVIKDVGRVFGFSFDETNQITSLVPDELNISLERSLAESTALREKMESDPRVAKLMQVALTLEGLTRNIGMHAAGVIITEEPVSTYAPLYVTEDGDVLVQFDKDNAEAVGLVKFDFLGLKTLTVIDTALRLIRENSKEGAKELKWTADDIPLNDPEVFRFLSSGDTDGIFQVESSGMKDLCTRLVPESLEEVTAINALFRPGPLGSGMVDDFIEGKHGRKKIHYDWPALEPILKETYGVILYQEQVMRIARELAGYSLGQADMLRRAMGKKKPEEMAKQRAHFLEGAKKTGVPLKTAESIFDLMAKFAEYGFNKSHSAAYGVITLQTAYLKRHFPVEFMAALMTTEVSNTDKITRYISNARSLGLSILPPDVNQSWKNFSVEKLKDGKKGIRFGLEAIKGVGSIAVDSIIEARQKDGNFKNVLDFSTRVSTRRVNKKVLESLVLSGALDSLSDTHRASLFSSIEGILEHASKTQEEEALGQSSLFDSFSSDSIRPSISPRTLFKPEPEWGLGKRLNYERQILGFYVSGHPMQGWQRITEDWLGNSIDRIKKMPPVKPDPAQSQPGMPYQRPRRPKVKLAGIFTEIKEVTTKKGDRMAIVAFEDLNAKMEVVFFPEAYKKSEEDLKRSHALTDPMILEGELDWRGEAPQILVNLIRPLAQAYEGSTRRIVVRLTPSQTTPDLLRELKNEVLADQGRFPVSIEFEENGAKTRMDLPVAFKASGSPALIDRISKLVGQDSVRLTDLS